MARLLSIYLVLNARLLTKVDGMANMKWNQTRRSKIKITLVFKGQKCALVCRLHENNNNNNKKTKIRSTLNIHDLT